MTSPIPPGTLNWDVPLNAYLENLDAGQEWRPADQAALAWSFDFSIVPTGGTVTNAAQPNNSSVRVAKVGIRNPMTISNITVSVSTAGVALTAGQNFVGLYDTAGNLVAQSADQTTAWGTTGLKTAALTVPYASGAGYLYAALLCNGATPPAFYAAATPSGLALNFGLATAAARASFSPSSYTTLPATLPLGSSTASGTLHWAVLT